jgi:hypothetical protein
MNKLRENESPLPPGTELETNEEIDRVREELKQQSAQRTPHEKKPSPSRSVQPYRSTVLTTAKSRVRQ